MRARHAGNDLILPVAKILFMYNYDESLVLASS